MATTIKKGLICRDDTLDEGLFPYTSIDCVFDENGVPIKDLLVLNMDLLWENANPYRSFSEQTIALDLSEYDFLYITYCIAVDSASGKRFNSCIVNIDSSYYQPLSYYSGNTSGLTRRNIMANSSSVYFGGGMYGTASSTNCNVPFRIYGINANIRDLTTGG